MRLLWLTENYPPRRGGMAQACDRIVMNLRRAGLTVDLVFFSCAATRICCNECQQGLEIVMPVADSPAHDLNCLFNLLQRPALKAAYSGIVAFGGNLPVLALPVFAAWLTCPAYTLLRGNDFDLGIFVPQRRLALRDAVMASRKVCVLSNELLQRVVSFFSGANLTVVPNGIDTEVWQPEPFDITRAEAWRQANVDPARIVVGMIGQFKAKKGGMFLLENVIKAGMTRDFHFVLVGDVENDLQVWLEQNEHQLQISRFPFTDRFQLISHYLACDYIALPSHYDGMPNVLLEAGALGCPVIAARTGGIAEVLPDEMQPLTFHPGDSDECRQALRNALNQTAESRKSAGQALKNRINSDFNAATETAAYLNIFQAHTKGIQS